MSSKLVRLVFACSCLAMVSKVVHAQEASESRKGWLHLGVAHIDFHPKADVSIGGGPFGPITDVRVQNNQAVVVDVGYELAPGWIASVLVGTPPRTTLTSASFGGDLGRVRYGSLVFSVHYHFGLGKLRPYVGGGAGYAVMLNSKDASLRDLNVDNAWAPAAIVGVEYPFSRTLSAYLDVRKLWLRTHATAAGGVRANLRLDPVIVSAGIGLRF